MDCRVIDGKDLGGGPLSPAIERRIESTDALVALVTPQLDDHGNASSPRFVESEFNFARGKNMRTLSIVDNSVGAAGLGGQDEHVRYTSGAELDAILKLAATLNLWRRELGRPIKVRLEPHDVARRFDPDNGHRCEYKTRIGPMEEDWVPTQIWPEPGGIFVYIPNMRDEGLVRVRVQLNAERWRSVFTSPQLSGITLEQER